MQGRQIPKAAASGSPDKKAMLY
jgi:hypothetical protein